MKQISIKVLRLYRMPVLQALRRQQYQATAEFLGHPSRPFHSVRLTLFHCVMLSSMPVALLSDSLPRLSWIQS